jgi:hypothetical protein
MMGRLSGASERAAFSRAATTCQQIELGTRAHRCEALPGLLRAAQEVAHDALVGLAGRPALRTLVVPDFAL